MNSQDCLIIIDIQNDFCPGGALEVPMGDKIVPLVNRLMGHFANRILTQDWHPCDHISFASNHPDSEPFSTITVSYGDQILWPDHCMQKTHGAAFHPDLDTNKCELILRKGFHRAIDSYAAFFENDKPTDTGLTGYLRARDLKNLYLAGLALDYCVLYSALDACKAGFEVYVIEDACCAINIDNSLAHARKQLNKANVNIIQSPDIT